jgi:hypothetical protein
MSRPDLWRTLPRSVYTISGRRAGAIFHGTGERTGWAGVPEWGLTLWFKTEAEAHSYVLERAERAELYRLSSKAV